jgi:hypothetical protein
MQRLEWNVCQACRRDITLGGERQNHAVAIEMSDPGYEISIHADATPETGDSGLCHGLLWWQCLLKSQVMGNCVSRQ